MVEMTVKNPTALTFTGGKSAVRLAYRTDAVFGSYQVVPRTEVKNSDVVFVGYGINAPEKSWNDYAGVDAKGKTVVILVNDPDWQASDLKGDFGGRAMTYYGRWTYKFEEAARQGAAAAIIVHDTEPAAYGFGVVQSSWTGPQLQLDATNNHMDQSNVIGWITNPGARSLFASAGKDFEALAAAAKVKGFKAVPLGVQASVAFDSSVRRQASKNVVGILPGKTAPDEYVLYSAHWDHLGRCDAVAGDDICNGALDNATGVAALVALAETNIKIGPARRSQVFLAVTGEESGLLGSEYYAVNPVYPLSKTVGGVNMDGLNVIGRVRDFEMTGAGKSEIEDLARPLFQAQGRLETPEATPEKGYYYRSDHFSFAKLGVPMLAAGSGEDLVVGGKAAGKAAADDYVVNRYHRPDDEYDPKWDWSGALQDLQVYHTLGRQLADGSAWPNWYPTAEFRAARDKSRAQANQAK
jgi:Zn-dependent M28 family amino/carboxypeptidase